MSKIVEDYEIVDHGIDNSQYFQGCGTAFTEFEEVATGIGDDFAEAIDDCLEMLAQQGWDAEQLEKKIKVDEHWTVAGYPQSNSVSDMLDDEDVSEEDREDCECYYHVSIRVR